MPAPWSRSLLLFLAVVTLSAHAPPTPLPALPVRVDGNRLVDANGVEFLIRGVQMPGLEAAAPTALDLDARRAMTPSTFRVIQQRWNMNAVRLPVSVPVWQREGQPYLDRIAAVIAMANSEKLMVVLAPYNDVRAGAATDSGLPTAAVLDFWRAAGTFFKDTPGLIFSLANEPSTRSIPGSVAGVHRPEDWRTWRDGGNSFIGMQTLVDAIRERGARQLLAVPGFHDSLGFQGFGSEFFLRDPGIVYEMHPFFDQGLTDELRDRNFGFLLEKFPVLAGAWGVTIGNNDAGCRALPSGAVSATNILFETVTYFFRRNVSWVAADFAPGSLIRNFDDYTATDLPNTWNCAAAPDGATGIGGFLLLWMTGDVNGFGSIDATQIGSAAGGVPGAVAPGQIITIAGQGIGPEQPAEARLESGRLATTAGDVQVTFDGVAAPVLLASYFQVNVQVPYEVAGRIAAVVRLVYRGVSSNAVSLAVAPAAPGIFTGVGGTDAKVLNQDGSINDPANPASRGSIVAVFATGTGQTDPPSRTGVPAALPLPAPALPVTVTVSGRPAEILYAGPAPTLTGVTQINVRVPADLPLDGTSQRASIAIIVGGVASRSGVVFWAK